MEGTYLKLRGEHSMFSQSKNWRKTVIFYIKTNSDIRNQMLNLHRFGHQICFGPSMWRWDGALSSTLGALDHGIDSCSSSDPPEGLVLSCSYTPGMSHIFNSPGLRVRSVGASGLCDGKTCMSALVSCSPIGAICKFGHT